MTDINGIPIIATEAPPANALAIAQVPVELAKGQDIFEIGLREPGIIRACAFWLFEPKVVASALRGVQKIPMPLLFVECSPTGKIPEQRRVFAFVPSDRAFVPKPGWQARYVATAIGEHGAKHLLELFEVQ